MSTLLLDAGVLLAAFDTDDELHELARSLLTDTAVTLVCEVINAEGVTGTETVDRPREGSGPRTRTSNRIPQVSAAEHQDRLPVRNGEQAGAGYPSAPESRCCAAIM